MIDWRAWFMRDTATPGSRPTEEEERYQAFTARWWKEEYPKVKAQLIKDLRVAATREPHQSRMHFNLIDTTEEQTDETG